ncbi:hypothetical protein CBOM_03880 [Ceraceosorus bombacis]|uniref:Apple domain-containing protein n=1 Tax=Ceraceosorus bombacis TaxID=401625 RepID=A0A0P1BIB9_9BASI|nr:hypothetical protein CBOM_03880 [Ceraceosorus bombacis]
MPSPRPAPQDGIDFDGLDNPIDGDTPTGPAPGVAVAAKIDDYSVDESAVTDTIVSAVADDASDDGETLSRRGTCTNNGNLGCGPRVSSPADTPEAFLASTTLANLAKDAINPAGFVFVKDSSGKPWRNYQASAEASGYYGVKYLKSYDVNACADFCKSANPNCNAFVIYAERAPSVDPTAANRNPKSMTNLVCTAYSSLTTAAATNRESYRYDFKVVMAASNAYQRPTINDLAAIPGYTLNTLPGSLQAPSGYMGALTLSSDFNTANCATACTKKTGCVQFVSYALELNGVPNAQQCAFYNKVWGAEYATNTGQWRGSDHVTLSRVVTGVVSQ